MWDTFSKYDIRFMCVPTSSTPRHYEKVPTGFNISASRKDANEAALFLVASSAIAATELVQAIPAGAGTASRKMYSVRKTLAPEGNVK